MLIVKSSSVWHGRKTFVPNPIPPKNFVLVDFALLAVKVLKGTAFLAWWIWLMTWWSAMVLKDSSALFISHNKDSQWWVGSLSMNEGWSWTFWLFQDTWGPTHAYWGVFPGSVNTRFLLLRTRGERRFWQARRALYIFSNPHCPMMESVISRSKQMNGRQPSIRRKVRPISPLISSWIWRSDTWWHLHLTFLGGVQEEFPPSKTIMFSLMSEIEKVNWSGGGTTSRRRRCCFWSFFFERRNRRWWTGPETPSLKWATAAHWVRREQLAFFWEYTWNHELEEVETSCEESGRRFEWLASETVSAWQLDPNDTLLWMEGG